MKANVELENRFDEFAYMDLSQKFKVVVADVEYHRSILTKEKKIMPQQLRSEDLSDSSDEEA